MVRSILGGVIFIATLVSVMVRPYRVSEAVSAAAGAVLMLALGFVRLPEAAGLLAGQWNTLGFFLGLMVISAVSEEAGVFSTLGYQAARWGRGHRSRLEPHQQRADGAPHGLHAPQPAERRPRGGVPPVRGHVRRRPGTEPHHRGLPGLHVVAPDPAPAGTGSFHAAVFQAGNDVRTGPAHRRVPLDLGKAL